MRGRSHRAGRAARKRRRKQESLVQSGMNEFTAVLLLYMNVSVLLAVSAPTHVSLSLSSGSCHHLSVSLCVFSVSVSPAAVREIDEVSSPTRIHLDAAAARPLLWYDSTYSSSHVIYLP